MRTSGKLEEIKGRIEEAIGVLTGNRKQQTRGKIDRAAGRTKQHTARAIDRVKKTAKQMTKTSR